jgi:hypothetical protein
MNRSFSKYLRIAGVAFMVALLSLSGGLNVFLGESIPAAKAQLAGQTGIARPKLIFRESDKQFLVVGENQGQHGIFVENPNPAGNSVCYQYKIDVPFDTGASSKAIRARATTDSSGNLYVIWMDAPTGSAYGFQAYMRVFDPNCNPTTASNVNVGNQLLKFGASGGNGYPDITWSSSDNRIYITWQGGLNGNYTNMVLAASAPAGLGGWDTNKWDQFWPLVDQNGMAPTPKLIADKGGRVHVIFRRDRGDHQAELRVADYAGGGWNTYGGAGKNISNDPSGSSDVTDTADISVSCNTNIAFAGWADNYAIGSMGVSTFDPSVGWDNGRQNVVSTNVGQISTGIAAGKDGSSVFLGQGYGAAQIWASTNRGQSFSPAANYNYNSNVNAITLAQGNNTVGIFTLDANRGNHFHTLVGGGSCVPPIVTTITSPTNPTTVIIPAGQPTTPVTITWDSTGGNPGATINYYLEFADAANVIWQPVPGAYPTTAKSAVFNMPGNKTYYFRVRGADGQGGDEATHPGVDLGIVGKFDLFTKVDVIMDASGYYAPLNTADPNNGGATDRGLLYYPLPKPTRLVDTRPGQAAYNAPGQAITSGTTQTFQIANVDYQAVGIKIPAEAVAVMGTVTAANEAGNGFLTTFPAGTNRPLAATMTYGTTPLSNYGTLLLGSGANAGKVTIYAHVTADVIVDVAGYFAPPNTPDPNNGGATDRGLLYYPLPKPTRLVDTRPGQPAYNTPGQPITSGTTQTFQMANVNYQAVNVKVPVEAQSIVGTIFAVDDTFGSGFLTAYPTGATRPLSADLTYPIANRIYSTTSNMRLGNGQLTVYAHTTTNIIVDATGYFAPPNTADPNNGGATDRGLAYYVLPSPMRLLDTRPGQPALYTPGAPISTSSVANYQVAGVNYQAVNIQIPSAARAVDTNTTVLITPYAAGQGYLTVYPGPQDTSGSQRPLAANVFYYAGDVISNAGIQAVGPNGNNTINVSVASFY